MVEMRDQQYFNACICVCMCFVMCVLYIQYICTLFLSSFDATVFRRFRRLFKYVIFTLENSP